MKINLHVKATNHSDISDREKENSFLARESAVEGIVLLKNDGVLPLNEKKVALFGTGARKTIEGGTGSGEVNNRYSINIKEGLKKAGYIITTQRWLNDFDSSYLDAYAEWEKAIKKRLKKVSLSQFFWQNQNFLLGFHRVDSSLMMILLKVKRTQLFMY